MFRRVSWLKITARSEPYPCREGARQIRVGAFTTWGLQTTAGSLGFRVGVFLLSAAALVLLAPVRSHVCLSSWTKCRINSTCRHLEIQGLLKNCPRHGALWRGVLCSYLYPGLTGDETLEKHLRYLEMKALERKCQKPACIARGLDPLQSLYSPGEGTQSNQSTARLPTAYSRKPPSPKPTPPAPWAHAPSRSSCHGLPGCGGGCSVKFKM